MTLHGFSQAMQEEMHANENLALGTQMQHTPSSLTKSSVLPALVPPAAPATVAAAAAAAGNIAGTAPNDHHK